MRKLLVIVVLFLLCIFLASCGTMGMQRTVHIPAKVPRGWQGTRI